MKTTSPTRRFPRQSWQTHNLTVMYIHFFEGGGFEERGGGSPEIFPDDSFEKFEVYSRIGAKENATEREKFLLLSRIGRRERDRSVWYLPEPIWPQIVFDARRCCLLAPDVNENTKRGRGISFFLQSKFGDCY